MIGRTLSHYRILEKIGQGGMGEVYLAEDTKLDRKVALKVLPADLAESAERRARFEREAKAVAALNHPNIVHVYSVEEEEGVSFLTMELVRGKTVAEILPQHGFTLGKFFDIAIPLADAVAAAHAQGILHRDLKPANVMVSEEGRVKVLDFGLAKRAQGLVAEGSDIPTETRTAQGAINGTLAYMSPEQAQGLVVDHRSDVFSLGILLYEMLTGKRTFGGDTPAATLSSVLRDSPPSVTETRADVPRELSKLVRRTLAKEPDRRPQSALDIRNALEELKGEWSSGELDVSIKPRFSVNRWLAAATALSLLAVAWLLTRSERGDSVPRLVNPVQVTSSVGVENQPSWSPDGRQLAYESDRSGEWDIWVTQLGGGDVNRTAGHSGQARRPSWSPDGRQIAFFSQTQDDWGLYTMPAVGGDARKVSSVSFRGEALTSPQWSADGTRVAFSHLPHLRDSKEGPSAEIVSLQTREVRRVPLGGRVGNERLDLSWSPNGELFAYVDAINGGADVTRILIAPSSGGEPISITDGLTAAWSPSWSRDNATIYFISNQGGAMDLWHQRLSKEGRPRGAPERLTTGVGIRSVAFSPDGKKLAYSRGPRQTADTVWRVPILNDRLATWKDAEQLISDAAFIQFLDVSPDKKLLALSSDRAGNQDLWILPIDGGDLIQLTTEPTPDWAPRWSPDGREILFYAYRSGNRDIWVMPAEGGPARQLTVDPTEDEVPTWAPDGTRIAFVARRGGNRDVWVMNADGREPRPLTTRPADDYVPEYSPDGAFIVFADDEGVVRIPAEGGEIEFLTRGYVSRWAPDGEVLYFPRYYGANDIWALSVKSGGERPVTDFVGRRGNLAMGLATDGEYLYFTWSEDIGDIWVMDVNP